MTSIKMIAVVAAMAGFSSVALADIYQWVDDNGLVHFTDDPDRIPARYQNRVRETPSPTVLHPDDSAMRNTPSQNPLQSSDSAPDANLPGGLSEDEWRSRFAAIRTEIKDLRDKLPKKREELNQLRRMRVIYQRVQDRTAYNEKQAEVDRYEARIKELEGQLSALDTEASRAAVPMDWRQ